MLQNNFEESYKRLNTEQKKAVDAVEGPVMIIAGPGTGKTQILSLRIANILKKTDTSPDSILALTFTESGVHSMRKRLVSIIGSLAYRVNIFTFHGFCNNIIKTYPEDFPRIISSKNISPIDQVKLMESVIMDSELELLRPYGDKLYYLDHIIRAISELKREDIDPDKFENLIHEEEEYFKGIDDLYHEKGQHKGKMKGKYVDSLKFINKNKELLQLYRDYEGALIENKLYDYEDMIMETARTLKKDPELLLRLQENYQYILVDEHQDTNNAQNKVLELISGFYESPNLFIVGDEKQAIFRFQGASLNNFLYFKDLYKDAKIIYLEENYRSTQSILDSAHSLIQKGGGEGAELRKRLISKSLLVENKLYLSSFSSSESEIFGIVDSIKEKIDAGLSPGEIAVIYRDNNDVFPLIEALEKTQIPFIVESDQNVLDDNDIKKLLIFLEAVNNFGEDDKFIKLMHLDFLKIDELFLYKIIKHAEKNKKRVLDTVHSADFPEGSNQEDISKIQDLYKKLSLWSKLSKNKDLLDFSEIFIRESGFLNYLLCGKDSTGKIEKLSVLFDNMKQIVENHRDFKLSQFMEFLEMAKERRLMKKSGGQRSDLDRVHLLTAHRSKGLEFEVVYIFGLYDTHWGNRRSPSYFKLPITVSPSEEFDQNDDERRLFYVSITRARKEVLLSYSRQNSEGRLLFPSQFIGEIDSQFIEENKNLATLDEVRNNKIKLFSPKINQGVGINNKEFLNQLFLSRGFSVTALNNYLRCPWGYFYRNLIRVPEAPVRPIMYGNVIHYTLRDFFNKLKEGEDIGHKNLTKLFEKYLGLEPLNKHDYKDAGEKGVKSLRGYYQQYIGEWNRSILNEFNVHGILFGDKISLTGRIDKIEILDSANNVNVVDYKTGTPKSRSKIEGNEKDGGGDYKRQLVFYKLLLDGYEDGRYKVRSGEIDFVEPDTRGKYKKEKFEITEEDVSELKKTIETVVDEIINLKFWNKKCDDKKCQYCLMRQIMKGDNSC